MMVTYRAKIVDNRVAEEIQASEEHGNLKNKHNEYNNRLARNVTRRSGLLAKNKDKVEAETIKHGITVSKEERKTAMEWEKGEQTRLDELRANSGRLSGSKEKTEADEIKRQIAGSKAKRKAAMEWEREEQLKLEELSGGKPTAKRPRTQQITAGEGSSSSGRVSLRALKESGQRQEQTAGLSIFLSSLRYLNPANDSNIQVLVYLACQLGLGMLNASSPRSCYPPLPHLHGRLPCLKLL